MICPTCHQPADHLTPTACRDVDGPFRADVCDDCRESFERELRIMGSFATRDARTF